MWNDCRKEREAKIKQEKERQQKIEGDKEEQRKKVLEQKEVSILRQTIIIFIIILAIYYRTGQHLLSSVPNLNMNISYPV